MGHQFIKPNFRNTASNYSIKLTLAWLLQHHIPGLLTRSSFTDVGKANKNLIIDHMRKPQELRPIRRSA